MIFNESYTSSAADMSGIKESPYALGLEGALMHVYENECNYNALMKSVGIAEARYAVENGGELFVQEAGAFGGFLSKAKDFFMKVIEKIKQIFKKFVALMDRFVLDDKSFVKKYGDQILRRDLTDFEVKNCYNFKDLDGFLGTIGSTADKTTSEVVKYFENMKATLRIRKSSEVDWANSSGFNSKYAPRTRKLDDDGNYVEGHDIKNDPFKDADAVNDEIEKRRGEAIDRKGKSYDEKEFSDEVTEICYGDGKDTIEFSTTDLRTILDKIKSASKDISNAEKCKNAIVNAIENVIKETDNYIKELNKARPASQVPNGKEAQLAYDNDTIKLANQNITILKGVSNAYTIAYGIAIKALKDRNRQNKAVCVKALSYKHEATAYGGDDLFANVSIY